VDHTPPRLEKFAAKRTQDGFAVSCVAEDGASPLAEAWLELPDGTSVRLDPTDGVCDSRREEFAWSCAFPTPGKAAPAEPWRLRVGVVDRAGNVATDEGEAH
jgi:hypothetical protein